MLKLVESVDLDPIDAGDNDPLCFRIEILKNTSTNEYVPKIFRWETMRLHPSFSAVVADHRILIEDDGFDISELSGVNPDEVIKRVQQRLRELFTAAPSKDDGRSG